MSDEIRPLRVSEAAAQLNLSNFLIRQAIRNGQLDAFRIGRTVRVRPESVDRLRHGPPDASQEAAPSAARSPP
jgi:excisionase family DNA binding protein